MRSPRRLRRALIVAPGWIGDALLAQPLLARLRLRHAGLALDALAAAPVTGLLARMPEIDQVIDLGAAHGELKLGRRLRIARDLAARGYDAAFVLPNSLKSALVPFLARIPLRIGYTGEARLGLINCRHRLDRAALPLMAERYAQLAEPPGAAPERPLPEVRLRCDPQRRSALCRALGLDPEQPVIALCPGAEFGPAKRWPPRHFAALAAALAARGAASWLFGSGKDRDVAAAILAEAPGTAVDLTGRTTLEDAIDLMAGARAVVANDSGLMHIAAALGRPLVALYGSSSPAHTPPLTRRAELLWLRLECSPCYQRECPLGHLHCLNRLEPAAVLAALERVAPGWGG